MSAAFQSHCQTLAQALNATNLTWTTLSPNFWFVTITPSQTHDGVSAARSGFVIGSQTSTLQTTVTGPCRITFWWNIGGTDGCNLTFTVNGVLQTNYYQWGDWRKETFFLPSGTHTLRWINNGNTGSGVGYVDEVTYTAGAFAPEFTHQPLSQSQVRGLDAMMAVAAQGTPPLSYQWQFNGANIAAATNSFVVISNTQQINLGNYQVIVTNSAGSVTSSIAGLEFGQVAAWGQLDSVGWATATNGMTNVALLSAGISHDLALKSDGYVMGWGKNNAGELTIPTNCTNAIGLAAGSASSMAFFPSGEITPWGHQGYGVTAITNKPPGLSNIVAIALGLQHAVVLKSDGLVTAWGVHFQGATNVPSGLSNVVGIAAGSQHSLALKKDGTVVPWGFNAVGQTNVPAGLSNVVSVAAGWLQSMALKSDGTVRVWGSSQYGLTNVPPSATNVVAIAAGWYFCLALRSDGTVVAWGSNTYGQTNVPLSLTNVVAISANASHALALVGDAPLVTSALITNPIYSTNSFSATVPSQIGKLFALEYKNSLADFQWTLLPLFSGNGGNLILSDTNLTGTQRFYRVRRW